MAQPTLLSCTVVLTLVPDLGTELSFLFLFYVNNCWFAILNVEINRAVCYVPTAR